MLKSVKEFIKAVRNPESLMSWPNWFIEMDIFIYIINIYIFDEYK
jgi:hypothetical protein